jgi:hypothetical protein
MTQYALPLEITRTLVRVQVKYRGNWVSVSGAMPEIKAQRRLARLTRINPHDTYQLTPVSTPTPGGAA